MAKIVVAGLINLETTLQVDTFPLSYEPVRYPFFGVRSSVSGVGYNVAKALRTLGDEVQLLSLIGQGAVGGMVMQTLQADGLEGQGIRPELSQTPQSVVIYEPSGRRAIHVDLKDIQEHAYPPAQAQAALHDADAAVLCNINFARPLLSLARERRIPIITDVHALSDLNDAYNRDFMAAADVLFLSDEKLPFSPAACIRKIQSLYRPAVVVVGMGANGVLYATRSMVTPERIAAVTPRPVVNTIGAGDALLSAFTHFFAQGVPPAEALGLAVVFAGYKVGEDGAACGFLTEDELLKLMAR